MPWSSKNERPRETEMMPQIDGILETSLYVDDVERSVRFYETIFGFRRIDTAGERGCALQAGDRQVLLLFKKGSSPDHDGSGNLHLAFATSAPDLPAWEERLAEQGIAIEKRRAWEGGGKSLYFRDPDGHMLELATPGTWSIY